MPEDELGRVTELVRELGAEMARYEYASWLDEIIAELELERDAATDI